MQWLMVLYTVLLFFVLVPGVLVTLPPKANKTTVALTHAVVFALVYHLSHKAVRIMLSPYDNFEDAAKKANGVACADSKECMSGKCTGAAGAMKCTA